MTTYPPFADWICPHITEPEYQEPCNRDVARIFGSNHPYWPYCYSTEGGERDLLGYVIPPASEFQADPCQPYVMRGSGFPSPLMRPIESINSMGLFAVFGGYIGHRKRTEMLYMLETVNSARQNRPCEHRSPYFGYRMGDSPIFFPCEARALLGLESGSALLERLFCEIQALQRLYDALSVYSKYIPPIWQH